MINIEVTVADSLHGAGAAEVTAQIDARNIHAFRDEEVLYSVFTALCRMNHPDVGELTNVWEEEQRRKHQEAHHGKTGSTRSVFKRAVSIETLLASMDSGPVSATDSSDTAASGASSPTTSADALWVPASKVVRMDLGGCRLTSLPKGILERFSSLNILFLTNNDFCRIPPAIKSLEPHLTRLSLKSNKLTFVDCATELPSSMVHCILTDNAITTCTNMTALKRLRKMMLSGNRLTSFAALFFPPPPDPREDKARGSLSDTRTGQGSHVEDPVMITAAVEAVKGMELELLRLARNQIAAGGEKDADVALLQALPKLAWISFAGNPCCAGSTDAGGMRVDLGPCLMRSSQALPVLGEGATSVVHAGILEFSWDALLRLGVASYDERRASGCEHDASSVSLPVAVKVFKGVSSDGGPEDEIQVLRLLPPAAVPHSIGTAIGYAMPSVSATNQPQLLQPIYRRYTDNPLARAPTIDTVSRDIIDPSYTWPKSTVHHQHQDHHPVAFGWEQAYEVALGLSDSMRWMHEAEVLHGDIYLHNTYYTALVDFTAAVPTEGLSTVHSPQRDHLIQVVRQRLLGENPTASAMEGKKVINSDFGASFPMGALPAALRGALKSVEVRALGVAIDDLAALVRACAPSAEVQLTPHQLGLQQRLMELAQRCASSCSRPTAAAAHQFLTA